LEKFIFEQDLPEMERLMRRAVETGAKGGRYVLMETGGIPDTLTKQKFNSYLEISRRVRGQVGG
jgi:hypothetical protein